MSITLVKRVDEKCPHGIYEYSVEHSMWRFIKSDGEYFKPDSKGVYVIYFDNTKCSACRKYDGIWFPFVESYTQKKRDTRFMIILCDWFARECKSTAAAESFKKYDVHASPTTIVLYADDDGSVKYQEKYEGVMYEFELKLVLDNFEERAIKYLKGEKVSPPISKESSSKALEDIIMQILKALVQGKKEEG